MSNSKAVLPKAAAALVIAVLLALTVPFLSAALDAGPAGAQATNDESVEAVDQVELIPEYEGDADDDAWEAFDQCLEETYSEDELERDMTDAEWEAIEQQITEACGDLFPEGFSTGEEFDDEDFAAFDECMGFEELDELHDEMHDNAVFVVTGDSEQMLLLGDEAATVTITSDGTSVEVATTGDATITDLAAEFDEIDFEAEEEKFAECEALLPENVHFEALDDADFVVEAESEVVN